MTIFMPERSEEKIYEVMNRCSEQVEEGGSRYGGKTYEEGVLEALQWAAGEIEQDEWPFTDAPDGDQP